MEKLKVVPEPSERCTTVIFSAGSARPGLAATSCGSSQRVMRPMKMSASRGPVRRSWPGSMPATLNTGTTPPMAEGNWPRPASASSSGGSGLSEEPKSTVPALIWAIPPPEPIDW